MCIINIDISIYKIKDVYVDGDKDTDNGDLYAFENPCDYIICFSNYALGKQHTGILREQIWF